MSDVNPFEEFRPKPANPFAEFAPSAAPAMSAADTAWDAVKSLGIGAAKGTLGVAGMAGDLTDLGAKGIEKASNYVNDRLGLPRYERPTEQTLSGLVTGEAPKPKSSVLNNIPTAASLQKAVESQTGEFYKPKTFAGEVAQTAGELVPGLIGGPETLAAKLATRVAIPAVASEAAGQLPGIKGTELEPWARFGAALLSPAAAIRGITPNPVSSARQRLLDVLHDEGVTSVTAGQRTGNDTLKYAETFLGDAPGAGRQAQRVMRQGQEQFTEAAMRRAGAGPDATPEVLAQNQARLGQNFTDLSARNNLVPDNQFVTDIVDAARNYRRVPDSQQRALVQGYIDDIVGHVNNGNMPGPQYQEMRSRLSRQANSLRQSDPTLSETLRDMRNALDNAMQRSIPAGSGDAELWQQTRREYGAQKLIEKAASRAGEATGEGQIVPANLRNAIPKAGGGYARGEGDFSDLARAGATVMQPLPNSGTAHRLSLLNVLNQATFGAVPAIAGRAIMSRPAQAYLGNRVLGQMPGSRAVDGVTAALLAHEGHQEPTPQTRLVVHPAIVKALQDQQP